MIDSHAHIHFSDYKGETGQVIDRAKQAGVRTIINIGTDLPTSRQVIELAESHPEIYAAIGVHPHEVAKIRKGEVAELEKWAVHPKVVGVGEIGLDYYYEHSPREVQKERLGELIRLAHAVDLPLIIHCRDSFQDCFQILDQEEGWKRGGVFHCYTGNWEIAEQILSRGFYLSFSGILTFKKTDLLREVARRAPIERILVETDSPYLTPEPHRGKRNEPAYVQLVAAKLAELRQVSVQEIDEAVTRNLERLFGISEIH